MPWSEFIGNPGAVRQLAELAARHHGGRGAARTLILAGPEGIGKTTLAWMFALALHCAAPPEPGDFCGACASCAAAARPAEFGALAEAALEHREAEVRSAARETAPLQLAPHPSLRVYPPDGDFVSLPQARALIHQSQLQPPPGAAWVLVAPDFDRARWTTQAALLKTLEEPPPQAWILVLARNPLALLPTVRSRAAGVTLAPLGAGELAAALARERPAADAQLLARLAQGCPGRALGMDPDAYRAQRAEVLAWLRAAARGGEAVSVIRLSESTRMGKEKFESLLEILYSVLQDLVYLQSDFSEAVRNVDCLPELTQLSPALNGPRLVRVSEELDRIAAASGRNAFRPLALASWGLGLAAGVPRPEPVR